MRASFMESEVEDFNLISATADSDTSWEGHDYGIELSGWYEHGGDS